MVKSRSIASRNSNPRPGRNRRRPPTAAERPRERRSTDRPPEEFPVVGIGASAGGLEAFTKLLENLPANTGMAFVLVQHLDPKHPSMLREILGRSTSIPVDEIRQGMKILPDHVYVGPASADVAVVDGSFRVEPRKGGGPHRLAIDHFFFSLAERYKSLSIGVVLSGTLSDGALGLRAIKAEGGVTFAQDESSAKFFDMPRAAIDLGSVDFVRSPQQIAGELAKMGTHPYVRPRADGDLRPELPESDHARILSIVRKATGVDFSNYRQSTVQRRIARRMVVNKVDSPARYLQLLRKEPEEVHALYEDILITVTAFFRDPDVFRALKSDVFSAILKDRPAGLPVRVWVPGCSTGEEVYSIAISLFEALECVDVRPSIQIFATDISETAIEKARLGVYLESAMAGVSPERRKHFFTTADRGWRISRALRDVCVFARQDITVDPPFSNLDFISCRNLLIYLEPTLQRRVVPMFHYALRPKGFLLLGNAEAIAGFQELFAPVDRNHRIFVRRPGATRPSVDFGRARPPSVEMPAVADRSPEPSPTDLQKDADRLVLGLYGPAGVVVDDKYDVVQFRGRTAPFLEVPSGTASFNLLRMAREGLLVDLRAALLKAKRTHRGVRAEGLQIREDGRPQRVDIEVVPLGRGAGAGPHFLVLFERPGPRRQTPPMEARSKASGASQDVIVKLEQELTATKDYLQSIIEEQEATNEELKSANEEILSSNEELQSTNEELETAKEELQSSNEELTTVNEELQNRNAELVQANNDMVNLLAGTTLAIVMVDREGRLRHFTPQAEKLLNLIPTDVGRRLRDLQPNVKVGDLEDILRDVIEKMQGREREVQDTDGNWFLMRARAYQTADNRVEGAVIAFIDIDPLKTSIEQVNRARDYAQSLVETVREALVVLDMGFRIQTANQVFYRIFRTTPLQTEGKSFLSLWNLEESAPHLRGFLERTALDHEPLRDFEISLTGEGVRGATLVVNAQRVRLPGEANAVILVAIEDVTDRRRAESALRASEAQYRLIFETAREGIWLMDAESGLLIDVNPFLLDLLGYAREDLIGHRPWDVGLYEDEKAAKARFESRIAAGFDYEQEVALRTKSGQLAYVEAITNTYRLGDRLVTQANLRDVTERTKLQDQVRQMQKLDSIGRLAGGVAHDFNNLLNIISAHSTLLAREGLAAEKRAESSRSIEKAVERGSAVVKQLLTFARKTDVAFEPTNVNGLVEELSGMLRETFPRQIKVQTKLADSVPPIHADPNQIHQAILNLAFNARDAMPRGGVLTLGTDTVSGETLRHKFPEASGEFYVEVCVADSGEGMDPETRRRIFEPFFTTKGAKGQGLGLAVVYGIVNAHRGWIDLESESGKGTTFRLYFTVSRPPASGGGAPPEKKREEKAKARGGVLLFVEDEEMLLAPVRAMLEENGYEVLTARDGVEAVRCFEQNADRISAVLLDLGLPRLGGWQAFLKMRERDPSVRCIVASGNLDAEQRSEMAKEGVQASVRKPYTGAQILKVVRSVVN